jgi:hypothetical protein
VVRRKKQGNRRHRKKQSAVAKTQTSVNGGGEVVIYEAPNGEVRLDVRLNRETVWLSQRQMAVLFKTSIDNVGLHLRNIFKNGELEEVATTEDYSAVQKEGNGGVRRKLKHYET